MRANGRGTPPFLPHAVLLTRCPVLPIGTGMILRPHGGRCTPQGTAAAVAWGEGLSTGPAPGVFVHRKTGINGATKGIPYRTRRLPQRWSGSSGARKPWSVRPGVNRRQPFSGCRWWLPVRHQLVPTERSDGAAWCLVCEQRERPLRRECCGRRLLGASDRCCSWRERSEP